MNYINLKQIFRSLKQRWFYTIINIVGLGIGLGCTLLMAMYVVHEYSFDKYSNNTDRVYRVVQDKDVSTSYAMGEAFKNAIPEIEHLFRMSVSGNVRIKSGQGYINEDNLVYSENDMIEMLGMKLVFGKKENQLKSINTIMVSESLAKELFLTENPIGKTLELAVRNKLKPFEITGVYEDFPVHSSIQTDLITHIENEFSHAWDLSFALGLAEDAEEKDYRSDWELNQFTTFVALHTESDVKDIAQKCTDIAKKNKEDAKDVWFQPMSQIYLHSSNLEGNFYFASNNLESLKIFMGIGLLILIVAIINFILISNADNNVYINEIACRKVNGASRLQITWQQLSKSILLALISLWPALLFIWMVIPVFNRLFDKSLEIALIFQWQYMVVLLLLTVLTGVLAGTYLSFVVSKYNPVALFQKRLGHASKPGKYKGALVVVQFVVFMFLATCFFSMYRQYQYTLHKDIGITTENIISFAIGDKTLMSQSSAIRDQVMQNPHVIHCRGTSFTSPPNNNYIYLSYREKDTDEDGNIQAIFLGKGVTELLGIKVLDGRTFDSSEGSFSFNNKNGEKILVNHSAAKKLDLVVGGHFQQFEILGIVEDFNVNSLHRKLEPIIIAPQTNNLEYLLVKTDGNTADVVHHVRNICQGFAPGYFVDYELLDDKVAGFYKEEEKQMGTIGFFAAVAMGLSVLGLLGFVALNLVKMTKELGVRKINGAYIKDLVGMVNKQYVLWIGIAFLLSCPISYLVMQNWLAQFAYRINVSWWIFALVGLLALLMALVTVTWQSWRAAVRNPVEALRYE